jgi:HAMP domain-containing protein
MEQPTATTEEKLVHNVEWLRGQIERLDKEIEDIRTRPIQRLKDLAEELQEGKPSFITQLRVDNQWLCVCQYRGLMATGRSYHNKAAAEQEAAEEMWVLLTKR